MAREYDEAVNAEIETKRKAFLKQQAQADVDNAERRLRRAYADLEPISAEIADFCKMAPVIDAMNPAICGKSGFQARGQFQTLYAEVLADLTRRKCDLETRRDEQIERLARAQARVTEIALAERQLKELSDIKEK